MVMERCQDSKMIPKCKISEILAKKPPKRIYFISSSPCNWKPTWICFHRQEIPAHLALTDKVHLSLNEYWLYHIIKDLLMIRHLSDPLRDVRSPYSSTGEQFIYSQIPWTIRLWACLFLPWTFFFSSPFTDTKKMKGGKVIKMFVCVCVALLFVYVVESGGDERDQDREREWDRERDEICDLICSPGASLQSSLLLSSIISMETS